MKIRHGFHLVASGRAGFGLTHYLDCNVYMLQTGVGYVLFDSGAGIDPDAMLDEIRRDGVDPAAITTLFLTHGHADHSGGVEPLRQRLPQLKIAAGPKTAEILGRKDERLISLDRARGGFYPADYRWTAPVVDRVLRPNEVQISYGVGLTSSRRRDIAQTTAPTSCGTKAGLLSSAAMPSSPAARSSSRTSRTAVSARPSRP